MEVSHAKCTGCGHPMRIQRMRCDDCQVHIEGDFEVSALARLSMEDQVFAIAFIRSHGSIKKMEALFEISYPTVKNRLNSIVSELDRNFEVPSDNTQILERLARGEISVDEAMEQLS